ncbi:MAG: glycosyl hydrolase-related protein, partial [Anaerolineae bacterium]|nr:glycosyl hydrolase-related protein [Anaerolineae bacterium]
PTPLQAESAFAEGHFEVVERPLDLPTETEGWIEQPTPTHPQRTFVDVNDGKVGLMVANRGLPEYEVMSGPQGSTIALTLLRCVGWLSRDDLTTRRGHAGPALETPGAQSPGRYIFAYSLIPHAGGWQRAYREAHAFAAPLRAIPTGLHKGLLPPEQDFICIEPESLVISAIKMASLQGLVVRFYNIEEKEAQGQLRLSIPFTKAMLVNLNEEVISEIPIDEEGGITLPVRGKEIVTVEFL